MGQLLHALLCLYLLSANETTNKMVFSAAIPRLFSGRAQTTHTTGAAGAHTGARSLLSTTKTPLQLPGARMRTCPAGGRRYTRMLRTIDAAALL